MIDFPAWLDSRMAESRIHGDSVLSRRTGIPQPTIARWRGGARPQVETLHKLADELGLNILEVFVAAGYLSEEQAQLVEVPQPLEQIPTDVFAAEVMRRLNGGEVVAQVGDLRTRSGKAHYQAESKRRQGASGEQG